ncbi:MAG: phosphotransferase [Anaerolineae bacterium]|nr:phosphotransferase [Anaerolineae bacterium]
MKFKPETFLPPEATISAVLAYFNGKHPLPSPWQLQRPPTVITKPWSTLYFLTIGTKQQQRQLVVKIMRFPDQATAAVSYQSEELLLRGQHEYESLLRVYRHFLRQDDPHLRAVHPEAYLPDINALIMDFVPGQPLYDNNLSPRHLLSRQGMKQAMHMLQRCGKWLHWLHELPVDNAPADRCFGPADSLAILLEHVQQLRACGVDLESWPLWQPTLTALQQVSDDRQVWVHGDLHARNFFLLPDQSVVSMDTALDRLDSPYYDLGKLVADLKSRRARLLSLATFPTPAMIDALSQAFLAGYFAGSQPEPLLLALYEGRFLLQKWLESLEALRRTFNGRHAVWRIPVQRWIVNPTFYRIMASWMVKINQTLH